jgi:hypothetical protein
VQNPFEPRKYTVMNPQINRNGIATASVGNVAQNSVVTMWLVNCGNSDSFAGFH